MSDHFVEPYDDMPWLRSITKDDHGNDREGPFLRDLRDSLKTAIHDQQRLGQTNQQAKYVQYWREVLKHVRQDISSGYWEEENKVSDAMLRNTNKYKWGQIWNMGKAWMWQVPYFQGGAIPRKSNCPLCGEHDSGGHILESCSHPEMKKMHIYRHDEAARTMVNAVNKAHHGSFFIIADVGSASTLSDLGVHHKRIPTWVLPDSMLPPHHGPGHDHMVQCHEEPSLTRDKTRPDVMIFIFFIFFWVGETFITKMQ